MNKDYFLTTDRIGFSIWCQDDMNLARTLWGDLKVTRYICASGKFTEEDIAKRLSREISNNAEYHVQYWPVFELAAGELIGCCGLRPHGAREYEIGFHLRPEFWGQGYAVEAANAVIRYAFTTLNAEKLFAGHNPKNTASQKVLQKLGFTYTGDEFYEPTGLYHPSYELVNRITIRAAMPEDAEQIGMVHHQAWLETYTGILPDSFLAKRSPEKSAQMFWASQCRDMAVAEIAGKIVGFCGWGTFRGECRKENTGEIYGIYLLNEFKRMRLGQKMMTFAMGQLKADGYQEVGLWVLRDNTGAIKFYEKQGLRYSGTHKEMDLGRKVTELLYTAGV